MDIVDIHVHATIYLYILLSCILFQEIQLLFTKVTFCWWHVYFYEHISGVWSIIKFRWSTAGSKRISFIIEGLPWKITVNNWSILGTFPLYKKERERHSRAFPSDLNPGIIWVLLPAGLRIAQPCRYCFYSLAPKWVFRPTGACCPDERESWHGARLKPWYYMGFITGRSAHSAAMPVLFLLTGPKMGFSPHRGDTLPR